MGPNTTDDQRARASRAAARLAGSVDDGPGGTLIDGLEAADDPAAALAAARERLAPGGYLVIVVPNPAPAAARLAVLLGRATATRPSRYQSYADLVGLIEAAGLAVGHVERVDAPDDLAEAAGDWPLPDAVRDYLDGDPDARAAWYVVVAYPVPWPGMEWLRRRLRESAEASAAADRRADGISHELAAARAHVAELLKVQERLLAREEALSADLAAARDQLSAREGDLARAAARADELNARALSADAHREARDRETGQHLQAAKERERELHERVREAYALREAADRAADSALREAAERERALDIRLRQLLGRLDAVTAERDVLAGELEAVVAQRDALAGARGEAARASAERAALAAELAARRGFKNLARLAARRVLGMLRPTARG